MYACSEKLYLFRPLCQEFINIISNLLARNYNNWNSWFLLLKLARKVIINIVNSIMYLLYKLYSLLNDFPFHLYFIKIYSAKNMHFHIYLFFTKVPKTFSNPMVFIHQITCRTSYNSDCWVLASSFWLCWSWEEAENAFLTSTQLVLVLLVWGPHFRTSAFTVLTHLWEYLYKYKIIQVFKSYLASIFFVMNSNCFSFRL